MEAQKTNEEIVDEFKKMMTARYYYAHEGTKEEAYNWLTTILTLKDEAYKKEMEEAVKAERERIHNELVFFLEPYDDSKWLNTPTRDQLKNLILTPTKEVTEVLTNHRYDPGDEKRNPMQATKEVTEELTD